MSRRTFANGTMVKSLTFSVERTRVGCNARINALLVQTGVRLRTFIIALTTR